MLDLILNILKGVKTSLSIHNLLQCNDAFTRLDLRLVEIESNVSKLVDAHLNSGLLFLHKINSSLSVENRDYFAKEAHKEFVKAQAVYDNTEQKYLIALECSTLCEIIMHEPCMAINTLDQVGLYHYKRVKAQIPQIVYTLLKFPPLFGATQVTYITNITRDLYKTARCQEEINKAFLLGLENDKFYRHIQLFYNELKLLLPTKNGQDK